MKLWLLEAGIFPTPMGPWNPGYDKAFGFVIRAATEEKAREIASGDCGDEGKEAWLNPKLSICKELLLEGEEKIILRDFWDA